MVQYYHLLKNVSKPKLHCHHHDIMINLQNLRSLRFISQISESTKTKNPPSSISSVSKDHHLVSSSSHLPVVFHDFFLRYGIANFNIKGLIIKRPSLITELLHPDLQEPRFKIVQLSVGYASSPVQVLRHNLEKVIGPNILTLQNHGVSVKSILTLLANQPRTLMKRPDQFKETVDCVIKRTGLNPSRPMFIYAVAKLATMAEMNSSIWENKIRIYREFGFSDEQVLFMLKTHPSCMTASEIKIRRVIEILMKQMKMKPEEICRYPHLICSSVERRILPRCAVLKILFSQRVLTKRNGLGMWLSMMNEKKFLQRFVDKYVEKLPQLIKVYHRSTKGKMGSKLVGMKVGGESSSVASVDDGWTWGRSNSWMLEEDVYFILWVWLVALAFSWKRKCFHGNNFFVVFDRLMDGGKIFHNFS